MSSVQFDLARSRRRDWPANSCTSCRGRRTRCPRARRHRRGCPPLLRTLASRGTSGAPGSARTSRPSCATAAVRAGLPLPAAIAGPEKRPHGRLDVARSRPHAAKFSSVEQLIIPLPGRVSARIDVRSTSGTIFAGETLPGYRAHTGWRCRDSVPDAGSPSAPDHRGVPNRGRCRSPSPPQAIDQLEHVGDVFAPAHNLRGAGKRWNVRSRACPAKWHETPGRQSTGSWRHQPIDSSGQPCTNMISVPPSGRRKTERSSCAARSWRRAPGWGSSCCSPTLRIALALATRDKFR